VVAAVAAVLVVVAGWTSFARAEPPQDHARGVVAAVTSSTSAVTGTTRRALLSITITNPAGESVTVDGYAPTTRSSAATGLDAPRAHIGAGERVDITVDVALECDRAAALLLPDLQVRAEDGGQRTVPVVGVVSTLTDICAAGPDSGRPLTVVSTRRDGSALVLNVAAPSNRRTQVRAIHGAGVQLGARELPLTVDRRGEQIRLLPPPSCPRTWREDGMPSRLEVELDTEGPAVVRLEVGTALIQWALDVVCRPS
jgi:hypothetical protein